MKPMIYTMEMKEFLNNFIPGHSRKEIQKVFYENFNIFLTDAQIKYFCRKNRIFTGRTGRFEKGHRPTNAPPKGVCPPALAPYRYQKGNIRNCKPAGTERVNTLGYIEVKIDDLNKWKMKHVLAWEKKNGKVPDGYVVIFKDGDRKNCDIDNLMLVSRKVLGVMNRWGLSEYVGEEKETAVKIAELKIATMAAKRRLKNGSED